jgi:hypothetical protein
MKVRRLYFRLKTPMLGMSLSLLADKRATLISYRKLNILRTEDILMMNQTYFSDPHNENTKMPHRI